MRITDSWFTCNPSPTVRFSHRCPIISSNYKTLRTFQYSRFFPNTVDMTIMFITMDLYFVSFHGNNHSLSLLSFLGSFVLYISKSLCFVQYSELIYRTPISKV